MASTHTSVSCRRCAIEVPIGYAAKTLGFCPGCVQDEAEAPEIEQRPMSAFGESLKETLMAQNREPAKQYRAAEAEVPRGE